MSFACFLCPQLYSEHTQVHWGVPCFGWNHIWLKWLCRSYQTPTSPGPDMHLHFCDFSKSMLKYPQLPSPTQEKHLFALTLPLSNISQPPLWNWQGSCSKGFERLSKTLFPFQEALFPLGERFWHARCMIRYSLPYSAPLQVRLGHWGLSNWWLSLLASGANLSHVLGGNEKSLSR